MNTPNEDHLEDHAGGRIILPVVVLLLLLLNGDAIGQVKHIKRIIYKNGPTKVSVDPVAIAKFTMGKGFSEPIEFYGHDSCNCAINPKVKIIPKYRNLFQVREIPCNSMTEEIQLAGIGQFASIKSLRSAEFNSNFSGRNMPDTLITFEKESAVDLALIKILDPVGLRNIITDNRIKVEAANVENAQASIIGKNRYIFYNPAIINKILKEDYASIGVFAHELAHHIFFQDINNQTDPARLRALELEADEWAGYILRYMNAPIDSALLMTKFILTTDSTNTHPDKKRRIKYIIKGWKRAEETRLNNMVDPRYTGHFSSAMAYVNQRNFQRAIDEFTLSINYHPFFYKSFFFRAKAKIDLNQYASAIPDLNVFINSDSSNGEAYLNRSYCYSLTGNPQQGLKDAEKAMKLMTELKASKYAVRGIALYFSGRFHEAISDLTKAIDLDPKPVNAGYSIYYRALSYVRLFQFKQAIKDYNVVIRYDSMFLNAVLDRGATYYQLKKYDSALIDVNYVLKKMHTDSLSVKHQRALIFEGTKNYRAAIADYDYVINKDGANAKSLYWQRGNWKMELRDYNGAIADYTKAIEYFPHVMEGYSSRAYAHFMMGNYDRAISDFNFVAARQELSDFYQIYRAISLLRSTDVESAIKEIQRLCEKYSNLTALYIVLAAAKVESKHCEPKEILVDLEKGITQTVDKAALGLGYFVRGEVYEKLLKDKKRACMEYMMSNTYQFSGSEEALARLKCKKK